MPLNRPGHRSHKSFNLWPGLQLLSSVICYGWSEWWMNRLTAWTKSKFWTGLCWLLHSLISFNPRQLSRAIGSRICLCLHKSHQLLISSKIKQSKKINRHTHTHSCVRHINQKLISADQGPGQSLLVAEELSVISCSLTPLQFSSVQFSFSSVRFVAYGSRFWSFSSGVNTECSSKLHPVIHIWGYERIEYSWLPRSTIRYSPQCFGVCLFVWYAKLIWKPI